jgi:hypothetical protein
LLRETDATDAAALSDAVAKAGQDAAAVIAKIMR